MTDDHLSEAQYFEKHGAELGFPSPLSAGQKPYEFNMSAAQMKLQAGDFMGELIRHLGSLAETYAGGRPHLLYYPSGPSEIKLLVKPYASVLNKIYRINCLQNKRYPAEPKSFDLVKYRDIYDHKKINDLLRARLVCKYLDGPQHVSKGIKDLCDAKGLEFHQYAMNNDFGYYAWHCYIRVPVEIMLDAEVIEKSVSLELQVTTQLAESITGLTHGLYEDQRLRTKQESETEWRWQPRSQQFRSTYLGHTLHLLEGIIQTFRDEVLELQPDASADGSTGANQSFDADISSNVENAADAGAGRNEDV